VARSLSNIRRANTPQRQGFAAGRGPARAGTGRPTATPAEQIGLFFRVTREAQNLSQEQLAALTRRSPAHVSRAVVSAVERGSHLPGLEVLLTLSQVLHVSPNEVLERLELARAEPVDTHGKSFDDLDRQAGRSFRAGDARHAAVCYDAMLRLVQDDPPSDAIERVRKTATTELRRGSALRRCGATTAARNSIERSITLSEDMPEIQTQGYLVLAALLLQLGKLPLARDAVDRARQIADELGDVKLVGWCWIETGEVLAASGKPTEAHDAFLEARRLVRATDDTHHTIKVEGNIGQCLHELGRHAQARRRYLVAIALARRYEVPISEALWWVELGRLALDRGNPEEADVCAAAALGIAKPNDDRLTCFRAEWLRHLVQRQLRPEEPDRHRLAYLKRLYVQLEQHHGVEEIGQFKKLYWSHEPERGSS